MILSKIAEHSGTILMGFILISVILVSHSLYKNKEPNFATPDELTQLVLRNRDIRLADLVREDFVIRNRTFDNCHIYGPAVISLKGGVFTNNIFAVKSDIKLVEATFIETTNKNVLGVILIDRCVIRNCTFHKISFIDSAARIAEIKDSFK